MPKVIIGTGSGRCGTQTLAAQLSRQGNAFVLHEGIGYNARLSIHLPHLMHGRVKDLEWNRQSVSVRIALANRMNRRYIEVAHYFALNVPLLIEAGWRPKIIHLVRPAKEVIVSMLKKVTQESIIYKNGSHNEPSNAWAGWEDCFPQYPGISGPEEGFACYWNETNKTIESDVRKYGLDYLVVHTNKMNEESTWRRVLAFCGFRVWNVPVGVWNKSTGEVWISDDKIDAAVKKYCDWQMPEHLESR